MRYHRHHRLLSGPQGGRTRTRPRSGQRPALDSECRPGQSSGTGAGRRKRNRRFRGCRHRRARAASAGAGHSHSQRERFCEVIDSGLLPDSASGPSGHLVIAPGLTPTASTLRRFGLRRHAGTVRGHPGHADTTPTTAWRSTSRCLAERVRSTGTPRGKTGSTVKMSASQEIRSARYAPGVIPTMRLNHRVRWAWDENPHMSATAPSGSRRSTISVFARSIRRSVR